MSLKSAEFGERVEWILTDKNEFPKDDARSFISSPPQIIAPIVFVSDI